MGLKVTNLKETVRGLEQAGVDVADLKAAFSGIARKAQGLAAGFAPTRTGRLARSIRASTSKNYATVFAGGARAQYAAPINYGWPKRHITGAGFMQKADAAIRPEVLTTLTAAIDSMLRKKNLS